MPEYFHATINSHNPGDVICVPPRETSNAYQHAISQGKQWVETELEAARNGIAANRQFAVYASDSPENAALFASAQNSNTVIHVYEVSLDTVNASPMAVIGHIGTKSPAYPQLVDLINEYWAPQTSWNFLEYPANQLTVIKEIPLPDSIALSTAHCAYGTDCQLAQQMWP